MKTITRILFLACLGISYGQTLEWNQTIQSTSDIALSSFHRTNIGELLMAGQFASDCSYDNNNIQLYDDNDYSDIFVQKTDSDGNLIWQKKIGGFGYEELPFVTSDSNGNVLVLGSFDGSMIINDNTTLTSFGDYDTYVIKLDSNGQLLWAFSIGGSMLDYGYTIVADSMDNIFITGSFEGTVDFDPSGTAYELTAVPYTLLPNQGFDADQYIAKYDTDGNFIWAKQLGGAMSSAITITKSAINDQDDLLLTGIFKETVDFDPNESIVNFSSGQSGVIFDGFILKLNNQGNFEMAKQIEGLDGNIVIRDIETDTNDNIILTGEFGLTYDFDPGPNVSNLSSTNSSFDTFVLKLDVSGSFNWVKQFESSSDIIGFNLDVDNQNNVHVIGVFDTTTDFNPDSEQTFYLNTTNSPENFFENFLVSLNSNGDFINAYEFGGANVALYYDVKTDENNSLLLVGSFENTVDINPNLNEVESLTATGFRNAYILKLNNVLSDPDFQLDNFNIYPNPVKDYLYVNFKSLTDDSQYTIYDVSGRLIESGTMNMNSLNTVLDFRAFPNGSYFFKIGNNIPITLIKND